MAGKKLERRIFLKYCAATAIGSGLLANPINLLANDTEKHKKEKFKLSKPRWNIYDNGTYDLISNEIILRNCRPAIDGQGVMPKNVFLGDSPKGKRIVYELPGGFLMLDLKTDNDSISIGAEFSGFSQAPRWFSPISQAEVFGVDNFYKQGFGTNGPSGIYPLPGQELSGTILNQSHDSFMTFAFLGKEETIAIGNLDHHDFQQRFTIYNHQHIGGMENKQIMGNQVFFESGILLDKIHIEKEYIKLPELHFFTGNKPLETFRELAWRMSEVNEARKDSTTSYHWIASPATSDQNCSETLKKQLNYVKQNKLPMHSFCIKNYCIEGDWLEPNRNWPGGLDNAAREIFKDGFRAGISIAPLRISDQSKIFKNHQDWIIKNKNGQIIPEETCKGETFYALDATHPGVLKYISRVFKTLVKMGYIFYETTHLSYAYKDSNLVKREEPGRTDTQIFRNICQLIRTEIGPGSLWMANQTPYAPLIGFADIVKISDHQNTALESKTLRNILQESWYSHYFNNLFWQNSPGEIVLSGENKLSKDECLSLMRWAAILGGAVGTCDDMTQWTDEQLRQFRFLEPSKRPKNAYLPFWPNNENIKVAVRIYKADRSWGLLFVNDSMERQNKIFLLHNLIEKEEAYVFSWDESQQPLGNQNQLSVTLQPGQSKLFYLTERNQAPHPLLTLGGEIANENSATAYN